MAMDYVEPSALELRTLLNLAHQMREFLDNPLYQQAVATTRQQVFERWIRTEPGETELREQLWYQLRAIALIQGELQSVVDSGTVSQNQIDQNNFRRNLE